MSYFKLTTIFHFNFDLSSRKPSKINGRSISKCEASTYKSNTTLKCNYIEFGEKLVKFNGEIESLSSVAAFWNKIDNSFEKTS